MEFGLLGVSNDVEHIDGRFITSAKLRISHLIFAFDTTTCTIMPDVKITWKNLAS